MSKIDELAYVSVKYYIRSTWDLLVIGTLRRIKTFAIPIWCAHDSIKNL